MLALQYKHKQDRFDTFELFLDKNLGGYYWIFPNSDYTSVGCGGDLRSAKGNNMRQSLDDFIKGLKLKFDNQNLEAALINFDFRGYKFNNIYLTGDAAGLSTGLTGKGIYAACLSGKLVAEKICKIEYKVTTRAFQIYLFTKRIQDLFCKLLVNKFYRKIYFAFGMNLIKTKIGKSIITKVAT